MASNHRISTQYSKFLREVSGAEEPISPHQGKMNMPAEKLSGSELSDQRRANRYVHKLTVDAAIQLMTATEVVDANDESFSSRHGRCVQALMSESGS